MIKKITTIVCIIALLQSCRSVSPIHTCELEISIEKPDSIWLVADVSSRNPWFDGVAINSEGRLIMPEVETKEFIQWRNEYVKPADIFVVVKNISGNEINLFEEWNSWGYYNLKFIFDDSFHEYWVTKKLGNWYRNFPSWHRLKPGESFKIPVAFSENIWSGLDAVNKRKKRIVFVRALYDQHEPYNTYRRSSWKGSISSKLYHASKILPKRGFSEIRDIEVEVIFEDVDDLF